jgi:tripartite-type tricarboxylate transporter receptor subunit TctC
MLRRDLLRFTAALTMTWVATGAAFAPAARADAVSDFYKGKELRLVISTTVGTGYDAYARAVGRRLARHLPGNPSIVPQNMPGAGGLAAANHLYAVAPKDGTVIGMIQNTVPFEPLFENKAALFDPLRFNWLGTPATEVGLFIVYHTSKVRTLRDAQSQEFIAGTTGTASTPAFYGRLFNQLLGLKTRLVGGYPGQLELLLAMEKGEIDAMTSPFWSSLKVQRPTWQRDQTVHVLFQYGAAPHPDLKQVPFASDLVTNSVDKTLLAAAGAPLAAGRPIAAPPGIPADRLAALRAAMTATFKDPQFIADCEKQGIECTDTRSGSELEALIKDAYAAPDNVKRRLIAIQLGQ